MKGIYVYLTNGVVIGPILHYDDPDRVLREIRREGSPPVFEVDLSYHGGIGTEDASFNPDHVMRVGKSG